MSDYIAGLSCLALVVSPLFIPIAVTVVDWVRNRRPTDPADTPAAGTPHHAPEPKAVRRAGLA